MDLKKIKELIQLTKDSGIAELEVCEGEGTVRIVLQRSANFVTTEVQNQAPTPIVVSNQAEAPVKTSEKLLPAGHVIKSPMVGTVYLSANPDSKPFVEIGQHVKVGDTLCLIEAMKMFNRVESDCVGVVSACLIENSQPTEYDQSLFIIEKTTA